MKAVSLFHNLIDTTFHQEDSKSHWECRMIHQKICAMFVSHKRIEMKHQLDVLNARKTSAMNVSSITIDSCLIIESSACVRQEILFSNRHIFIFLHVRIIHQRSWICIVFDATFRCVRFVMLMDLTKDMMPQSLRK